MTLTPGGGSTIVGADNRPLLQAIGDAWRDFLSGNPEGTPDPSPGGAELTSINPTTAVHGTGADLTLHVIGTGFVQGFHQILWNGTPEPTTFVSATELTTIVKPSTASGASTVQVRVSGAEGQKPFTFT
jgi:IPT/TIG domain